MAITFGTPTNQTVNPGIPGDTSLNFTHTSSASADFVVIGFTTQSDSNAITPADLSATYDGVSCDVRVQGRDAIDRDFPNCLWVTVAPQTGTAVVLSTSAGALQNGSMWAVDVFGVDTGDPVGAGTAFDNDNDDDLVGEFALSTDDDGAVVFGLVSVQGTDAGPFTPSTSFTEQVDDTLGNGNSNGTSRLIETREVATAGSVTVDASWALVDGLTYAYFSMNPSVDTGTPVGQASETDTAQAINAQRIFALGLSSETDTAFDITPVAVGNDVPVGLASETDTAQAITVRRELVADLASEVDTAQDIVLSKAASVDIASETDTAQAITISRTLAVGFSEETDTAQTIDAVVAGQVPVGLSTETDTAQDVTAFKQAAVGISSETDTAQSIAPSRTAAVGISSETDTAQDVDISRIFGLGLASETDTAFDIISGGTRQVAVGQSSETDTALDITGQGGVQAVAIPLGAGSGGAMAAARTVQEMIRRRREEEEELIMALMEMD